MINITASTPKQAVEQIAIYLRLTASGKRNQARLASGKRTIESLNEQAEMLDFIARQLDGATIKAPPQPAPVELLLKRSSAHCDRCDTPLFCTGNNVCKLAEFE